MANSYTNKLKKRLPTPGDIGWDDEWYDNERIDDVVMGALMTANRVINGGAVTAGSGLNANYAAVDILVAGSPFSIIAGSLALTAAAVGAEQANWIYVSGAGAITVSTTPPSGDYVPLARVDTSDTAVIRVADLRPMVQSIHGFSNKTTPIDSDELSMWDSVTGLLRKVSWTNIKTTLKTYFDTIYANLVSPAFTGTPTAPTPANADNSTKLATTEFVKNILSGSAATTGYQKFPDGVIIQWGVQTTHATPGTAIAVPFLVGFPTACAVRVASGNMSTNVWTTNTATPLTSFNIVASSASVFGQWIAIGY